MDVMKNMKIIPTKAIHTSSNNVNNNPDDIRPGEQLWYSADTDNFPTITIDISAVISAMEKVSLFKPHNIDFYEVVLLKANKVLKKYKVK